ncbi:hypothetical protein BH23CHL2_BH23CHL2_26020 [soil metagenome]
MTTLTADRTSSNSVRSDTQKIDWLEAWDVGTPILTEDALSSINRRKISDMYSHEPSTFVVYESHEIGGGHVVLLLRPVQSLTEKTSRTPADVYRRPDPATHGIAEGLLDPLTYYLVRPAREVYESGNWDESAVEDPGLSALTWIKDRTQLSDERLAELIGVSRTAINNWRKGRVIHPNNRARILAVEDVLQRAADRYRTRIELTAWLDTPRGRNGLTPFDLLKTGEFDRARYLAVSRPSARVKAKRVLAANAELWPQAVEHRQEPIAPEDSELDGLLYQIFEDEDDRE